MAQNGSKGLFSQILSKVIAHMVSARVYVYVHVMCKSESELRLLKV